MMQLWPLEIANSEAHYGNMQAIRIALYSILWLMTAIVNMSLFLIIISSKNEIALVTEISGEDEEIEAILSERLLS